MFVKTITCPRCDIHYSNGKPLQTCSCGSPLLVQYDYTAIRKAFKKEMLNKRGNTLWRYRELLPVKNDANIVSFGEGMTPMVHLKSIGKRMETPALYLKDEGCIPTGTFKARGAAVGVSMARELGIKVLAMPTNGNAGGAWSSYCAAAGIRAVIVMPQDAPDINRRECAIAGADLFLVNGLISDAGKIVNRAIAENNWYDASTLREPYRIEGKKTMAFEIAEQFDWNVPDVIIYPTGGGVGLIGMYKGFKELMELGWIEAKMPRLVAVQSAGCAPIVKAWDEHAEECDFWESSRTIAFGINVPKALGDFLVLEALQESHGCAVAMCDHEIIAAQQLLALQEGLFVCPEGAATLAAAQWLVKRDWINPDDRVVLLNTGTGLKYPDTVRADPPVLTPNERILSP